MATITVKNIPDDLYQDLKNAAATHRRSINSEAIVCIEQAVQARRVDAERVLAAAREIRKLTAHLPPLTDDEITRMKHQGRT